MNLGVVTEGICRDFEQTPTMMEEFDLDAKGTPKILSHPSNNRRAHETARLDGHNTLGGGYLGNFGSACAHVDTPKSSVPMRRMGMGQLADRFQPIADAPRADNCNGIGSFDWVNYPGNSDFEAGFRRCIGVFEQILGALGRIEVRLT